MLANERHLVILTALYLSCVCVTMHIGESLRPSTEHGVPTRRSRSHRGVSFTRPDLTSTS